MNRNLFFMAAALLTWGIGEGMFFNFVPIRLENEFLLSKQQVGLVLGAFGFFMAITHLPGGHIADRFGRRPLLIFAWVVGMVSTLVMGLAQGLPLYLIGLLGYGLTAFVSSPLSSYMTAARGRLEVGTVLALTSAMFNFGMALGPVTGGWIAEHYGMRSSYLVAFCVFVLSNLFLIFVQAQPIDTHDPADPPPTLLNNSRFVNFLAIYAFTVFALYLAQPLTPNFLKGVRNLTFTETGWIFSAGALGNALITFIFSRVNPRRGFIIAQVLVILFAASIWQGTGMPFFMLGYFLLGGFRAARPMAMAQARELVHESQMGITYGAMETVAAVIFIIAPPIAGFIFDQDPFFIYPLSIGLTVISIFVCSFFIPRQPMIAK